MFLYAFGSMLFALAMTSALMVMMSDFARYRRAMLRALRSLSLDGLPVPAQAEQERPFTPTMPALAMQPLRSAAGRVYN